MDENRPETSAPQCAKEGCGLSIDSVVHAHLVGGVAYHEFVPPSPASATPDEPLCTRCGHDKGAHDSQGCVAGWIAGLRGCSCRAFETPAVPSPSATAAPATGETTPDIDGKLRLLRDLVDAAGYRPSARFDEAVKSISYAFGSLQNRNDAQALTIDSYVNLVEDMKRHREAALITTAERRIAELERTVEAAQQVVESEFMVNRDCVVSAARMQELRTALAEVQKS